jgi:hypothetical protein
MDRQEITEFWGRDNLKTWSEDSLREVAIPNLSKSFLAEVGLPFQEDWTFRFDEDANTLPRLPSKTTYRRIGFDYDVPICLDEANLGRVIAVEEEVAGTDRYINASVERFGEFLTLYKHFRRIGRLVPENQTKALIDEMELQMRTVDPSALDDANNYWAAIIEEMNLSLA